MVMTVTTNERSPFLQFLNESVQHWYDNKNEDGDSRAPTQAPPPPLEFVIGNEAGDADSIVSALTYAYVLHQQQQQQQESQSAGTAVIPIVSISRADLLTQRPETTLLLTWAGILPTKTPHENNDQPQQQELPLICIDELFRLSGVSGASEQNTTETKANTKTRVTLVDHNLISDSVSAAFSGGGGEVEVVEILDHHGDLRRHLETCPDDDDDTNSERRRRRHIAFHDGKALAASTCTLVTELWLQQQLKQQQLKQSKGDEIRLRLEPSVSLLLLGTIILDSLNLSPQGGKVTDRDIRAVEDLLRFADWSAFDARNMPRGVMLDLGLESILDCQTDDPNNNNDTDDDDNKEPGNNSSLSSIPPPLPPNGTSTRRLFQALQNAKFDVQFWNSLSVRDALRLDYKSFPFEKGGNKYCLGMSTVLIPWHDFRKKPNVWEQLQSFLVERGAGGEQQHGNVVLLAIMCCSSSPTSSSSSSSSNIALQRELILVSLPQQQTPSGDWVNSLAEALLGEHHDPPLLHLVEYEENDASNDLGVLVRSFRQNAIRASRKQVAPILLSILNDSNHPTLGQS